VKRLVALGAELYHAPNGEENRPGKWWFIRVPDNITLELNPETDAFPERLKQQEA